MGIEEDVKTQSLSESLLQLLRDREVVVCTLELAHDPIDDTLSWWTVAPLSSTTGSRKGTRTFIDVSSPAGYCIATALVGHGLRHFSWLKWLITGRIRWVVGIRSPQVVLRPSNAAPPGWEKSDPLERIQEEIETLRTLPVESLSVLYHWAGHARRGAWELGLKDLSEFCDTLCTYVGMLRWDRGASEGLAPISEMSMKYEERLFSQLAVLLDQGDEEKDETPVEAG